jgi:hypothetical protein
MFGVDMTGDITMVVLRHLNIIGMYLNTRKFKGGIDHHRLTMK